MQGGIIQQRREFESMSHGKRLKVKPLGRPAAVKIDHPSTITAERARRAGGYNREAEFVEV